jgi:DNA-binding NarL/FixJ family response regulator
MNEAPRSACCRSRWRPIGPGELDAVIRTARAVLAVAHFAASALAPTGDPIRRLLSKREFEVLQLCAAGRASREIAESLHITTRTVSYHIDHVLAKLSARNRAEAVAKASAIGILEHPPLT